MKDTTLDIVEDYHWLSPPGPGWHWGPWACLVAWMIFFAGLGWYWHRRRKLGLPFFAVTPPHELALRALKESRQKLSEETQREFVISVSQVVRDYIQGRFGLRAPHRSTEEFLREVHEGDRLLLAHQELLGGFLGDCDLVKFAQQRVRLAQMSQMLESAERFVEATIPPRQPAIVHGRGA